MKNNFTNWEEKEEHLKVLLNSEEEFQKDQIIEQVDFFAFNLLDYDQSYWETIVLHGKSKCTWSNMISYTAEMGVDDYLLQNINNLNWIRGLDIYDEEMAKIIEHQEITDFWKFLFNHKICENSLIEMLNKYSDHLNENTLSIETELSNLLILISEKAFDENRSLAVYEKIKSYFGNDLIHLTFAKKCSAQILNFENNQEFFSLLRKEELVYIVRNDFPREYFQKAFEQISNLNTMQFEAEEAIDIIDLIKKYELADYQALLTHIFNFLPVHEQINVFVWLFENGKIDKFNSNKYLINFKDYLKNLDKTRIKFDISENIINERFVEILKRLQLINDFKITKSGQFSFYRNQFRSFDSLN
jgi:hypothetical protein